MALERKVLIIASVDIQVSIVIPFYGNINSLEKCLHALVRQKFQTPIAFEVLVVDNSPLGLDAPRVPKLAPSLPLRVFHEPRPGSYAARNRALREARGSSLLFTDADCIPCDEWIESTCACLEAMNENTCFYLAGRVRFLPTERASLAARYDRFFHLKQKHFAQTLSFAATANMGVRRVDFDKVGPFDESLLSGGDQDWGRRASLVGLRPRYFPDVFVWHPHVNALSDLLAKERRMAGGRVALRQKWPQFQRTPGKGLQTRYPRAGMMLSSRKPLGVFAFLILHIAVRAIHKLETLRCRLGGQARRA